MQSQNCILAFPDYVVGSQSTFDGGSWEADLPLGNLLRPEFALVARSTDADAESTRFWIDLGAPMDVQVAALVRHNLSTLARVRIRGFLAQDEGGEPECDTGWRELYGEVRPFEDLYWGHPSLWDGKYSPEEAALYDMPFVAVFRDAPVARHWLVEIDDESNADGYVQLARLVLCPGWQPSFNMSYGASLAVEDERPVQPSPSGAEFWGAGAKRRVVRFQLGFLPNDEALQWVADMQWRLGTSGQLMFVWRPDDPAHMHRRSFLGRLRTLSPLEQAFHGRMTAPFEIVEVVA